MGQTEGKMSGPNWKLADDREFVTIAFPTDPPAALRLNANQVDDVLDNLGALRAAMKREIPRTFALGQPVEAVADPIWATEPDALLGNSLLHLRDPRFGWLHYAIPKEEARKLARLLQSQADAPPPGQRSGKAN
jgi:hypothetical protein